MEKKYSKQDLEEFKEFTREKIYLENVLPVELKCDAAKRIAAAAIGGALLVLGIRELRKWLKGEKKNNIVIDIKPIEDPAEE